MAGSKTIITSEGNIWYNLLIWQNRSSAVRCPLQWLSLTWKPQAKSPVWDEADPGFGSYRGQSASPLRVSVLSSKKVKTMIAGTKNCVCKAEWTLYVTQALSKLIICEVPGSSWKSTLNISTQSMVVIMTVIIFIVTVISTSQMTRSTILWTSFYNSSSRNSNELKWCFELQI